MPTSSKDIRNQKLFIAGVFVYLVLAVLAVLFYKERTVFLDVAFLVFHFLKSGELFVQVNRFGSALTQIFPVMAVKANMSLPGVLITYSLGFILYFFGIFLLLFKVIKSPKFAISLVLFNVLMVAYTFYWVQSELIQGIAFMLLYFGFISKYKQVEEFSPVALSLVFLLLLTIVFFHPVMFFPFSFISLFLFLDKKLPQERKILITGILFFIGIFVIKKVFFKNWYDTQASGNLKNFINLFPNYFTIQSNKDFISYCLTDYYFVPIGLAVVSVFYFLKRNLKKLLLVLAFFFGYLLIVNVSYYQGTDQFYIESLYLPLGIFLIIPFVFDILPEVKEKYQFLILASIIIIRLTHIGLTHKPFTQRLDWQRNLLSNTAHLEQKKLIIDQKDVPMDTLMMTWGTSFEFFLLSSLETPDDVRSIIIDDNPERLNWTLGKNKSFIGKWTVFDYKDLPKRYFNLKDTTKYVKYQLD